MVICEFKIKLISINNGCKHFDRGTTEIDLRLIISAGANNECRTEKKGRIQ